MTLRIIEGWDYLPNDPATPVMGALGWSGNIDDCRTITQSAFNYGRSGYFGAGGNSSTIHRYLRGRYTTQYVWGMRMIIPTSGDGYYLRGTDANSTTQTQWSLQFDQFGIISYRRGSSPTGTILYQTLPGVFVPGNWFYLEIKITPGYSDGIIEIRINTVPVLSLINVRTAEGTPIVPHTLPAITHATWFQSRTTSAGGSSLNGWLNDDMYFLDDAGSINNDYLGNVRAKYMAVVADSTPLQFTIGGSAPAATNWQSVNNTAFNDAQYVYSSTVGHQDLYDIDPNLNTPTVYGVEVAGAYKQDDATQREVSNVIESNGVQKDGAVYAINQSYTFYFDIYELNPDTGLGFTGAEVNALKVGPKVIT